MALPPDAYSAVCSLFATGLSDRAISRQTGEAQASVSRWRRSPSPPTTVVRAEMDAAWGITDPRSYCYLLGAHLGDGTVYHQAPGFWGLRIVNDRQYQRISEEIRAAMSASFPGGSVRTWPSFIGESDILHASHPASRGPFRSTGPAASTHARSSWRTGNWHSPEPIRARWSAGWSIQMAAARGTASRPSCPVPGYSVRAVLLHQPPGRYPSHGDDHRPRGSSRRGGGGGGGGGGGVRAEGLEPPRALAHRHLKPARRPVPPRPRVLRAAILGRKR
jgi:hypothetical protein